MADNLVTLQITTGGTYVLSYGKTRLRSLMRQVGREVADVARALIERSVGSGRTYRGSGGSRYRGYRKGHYTASAPGQPPVSVTGTLANSIKVLPFKSGDGVAVRETAFYALFLAKGATGGGRKKGAKGKRATATSRVLLPRPSLTAALDERSASISARVKATIIDDIKFRKQRA